MTVSTVRGYAKGRAKRAQILDEAITVFGEVGYRSASLREIAARCGISHPGLLHHFPSKESLLEAVLERREMLNFERYLSEPSSGLEHLRGLVELVERNSQTPRIVELFASLSTEAGSRDHPAHEFFVRRYEHARSGLTAALARALAEGALRPGVEPEHAAVVMIALMDGLQVQWLLDRTSVDMAAVIRVHVSGLLVVPLARPRQIEDSST